MLTKRVMVLVFCGLLLTATAYAAPLTNFDTYHGSIDLGMWRTDASITDIPTDEFDNMNAEWRLSGGLTYRIGGRWGLQYVHHGMASDRDFTFQPETPQAYVAESKSFESPEEIIVPRHIKLNYTGYSNELNLLYSLKKDSNVALFIGANRVHNEIKGTAGGYTIGSAEGTRTHFQGGVVAKAPLGSKFDAYGLAGFGSHSLFQAEAGVAYKVKNDWDVNVGYRWFRVKDAFDEYGTNNSGHNSIDPIGTVKVQGITFGVTHFFGPAKKKEAAPVAEAPVVQPPVEQPVEEIKAPAKVVLKGVHFDFDKDTLQPQSYPILDNVVALAVKNPQWNFLLIGHTDSIGTDEYNMDLSMRRVKTVQGYLITKGVEQNRLGIDWKGEREPIATNDTPEGRAQNRRVELDIK